MKLGYAVLIVGVLASECEEPSDCDKYCRVQYKGEKSYYNETDGDCYKVAECGDNQYLDAENNKCIEKNTEIPETNNTSSNSGSDNETTIEDKPVICDHGTLKNSKCICDEGYTTSSSQNSSNYVYQCNILSSSDNTDNDYSTGENGELYLSSQSGDTINNIPLTFTERLAILAGISVFFCISTCIIRKKLRRKYL